MQVKAKATHAAYVEKVNMQARKLAAQQNQSVIRQQIADKIRKDALADAEMSSQERQFMKPLLAKAKATIKEPKCINIF